MKAYGAVDVKSPITSMDDVERRKILPLMGL
jgi:hypothetical protein